MQQELELFYLKLEGNYNNHEVAAINTRIGDCHLHLTQPVNALHRLKAALAIKENITLDSNKDKCIAITLSVIDNCHMNLQNYNEALTIFNISLQIKQNATLSPNKDNNIAVVLYNIAHCHMHF